MPTFTFTLPAPELGATITPTDNDALVIVPTEGAITRPVIRRDPRVLAVQTAGRTASAPAAERHALSRELPSRTTAAAPIRRFTTT